MQKNLSLVAAFVAGAVFLYTSSTVATPCDRNPAYCNGGSGDHKKPALKTPDRDREIQEETSCSSAAKKLEAVILDSISNETALEEVTDALSDLTSLCRQAETQESL